MKNHPNILYFETEFDYPLIVKGKGIYIYDEDGKEYIDGCAGSVSTSLGYGRSDIANVIKEQAETISFVHRHHVSSKICNESTDVMKEMFPSMDKFFLVSGGSEATEIATKIARLHYLKKGKPNKNKILSRWMSYHGYTLDALAYGGNPGRRKDFAPVLREDILYRSTLKYEKNFEKIRLWGANDRANIFIDNKHITTMYDRELLKEYNYVDEHRESLETNENSIIDILVENMGRVNFGPLMEHQRKGIKDCVQINGHIHYGWQMYPLPLDNLKNWIFPKVMWKNNLRFIK